MGRQRSAIGLHQGVGVMDLPFTERFFVDNPGLPLRQMMFAAT
jgi:hypothetical protein